jgi:hypothetical protein
LPAAAAVEILTAMTRPDLLFCDGSIFDGRSFLPPGTRVRVRAGRIVEVGDDLEAGGAGVVDLHGGTLLPGFIDAHAHPVFGGDQLRHCDLREGSSAADYAQLVAAYADDHPDETWITGGGWSMDMFPGGQPRRHELDAVVADRPVFLINADAHGGWVNSAALRLAGIDRATPQPPDGRIERDADGEPTGMLQEGAVDLVTRQIPPTSAEDWYESLLAAQSRLFSFGVTGWQDAIVGAYGGAADPMPSYLRAADDGCLQANVVGALWWDRERGLDQIDELVHRRATGMHDRFRPTSVKLMLDGIVENHTAAMLDPYVEHADCAAGTTGIDFIDAATVTAAVAALDAAGFQVHFHALGDRAVRHALDALAALPGPRRGGSGRHHLAHLQVVHPDDVGRFAALGATANIQALWAIHDVGMDELTVPYLGETRAAWQYPFRSLIDAGAPICAGSDWPVSSPDPLQAAHVAVNRTPPENPDERPLLPHQSLDLATFLAAYTSGSARICGLESSVGCVRVGLDADFAVVDADLRTLSSREIGSASVTQTWVRGDQVYAR